MNRDELELSLLNQIKPKEKDTYIMHLNNGFIIVDGNQLTESEFKALNIDTSNFTLITLNLGKEI